jgi:hypothetical protein
MKNIFFALSASLLLFASCDYVDVPHQAGGSIVVPTSDTIRRIFIEDFTGHTCPNCPRAKEMIEDSLQPHYPGHIIAMAVHTDFYATPCAPNGPPLGAPNGTFTEDFRVPGEDANYESIFTVSGFPFPSLLINRHGFPSSYPTSVGASPTLVDSILRLPMTAYLKITPNYNAGTRVLNVSVAGKFMVDTLGTFNIALFLTEDSIVAAQEDNLLNPAYNLSYTFNGIFRGCINTPGSIIGETTNVGAISANTGISYTSPAFTVNSNFNPAHCNIIAILYKTTDYGVLQAAESKLIP